MEGLADVVLYDIVEGMPQGKALDMLEATPLWGVDVEVVGTNELNDIRGSHLVVITAGVARKPGMSRDDLLQTNAEVVASVSRRLPELCPDAVVIVVTNPMDVMAQLCWQITGFPHKRVMGMGGVLDSARFRTFVADKLGVSVQDTEALVLGGHGDQMVPMPRFTTVRGIPITQLLPMEEIKKLIERTRYGGAEIVSLLKTGSAYYAPAASTLQMLRAVLIDEKRLLPAAAYLDGEYGVKGLFIGVPVVLGAGGVERIIELQLTEEERGFFEGSVNAVKGLVEKLKSFVS
jgi:malate dehydrogenase